MLGQFSQRYANEFEYLNWIKKLWKNFFFKEKKDEKIQESTILKINDLEIKQIISKNELLNTLDKINANIEALNDDLPYLYFLYKQEQLVAIISKKSILMVELFPTLLADDYKVIKSFQLKIESISN